MTETIMSMAGAFALSSLCGFIIIPALLNFCKKHKLYDKPDFRKVHKCMVPRLGGIAFLPSMIVSFLIVVAIMQAHNNGTKISVSPWTLALATSLVIVYSTGIVDDIIGLGAKVKFAAQIAAASILPMCGLYINNLYGLFGIGTIPFALGFPLTVFVIVFIDNAINLIDGIDGLAASLSVIALCGFINCLVPNGLLVYGVLIAGLVGVLMTYLYFNILGDPTRNRKIFMGDSGSLTIGFILGFLVVKAVKYDPSVAQFPMERVLLACSLLIVPTFDVVRVVMLRMRYRQPLFRADKRHIHHKLMAAGLTQHQALAVIIILTLAIAATNVAMYSMLYMGPTAILAADIAIYALFHIALSRKAEQHNTVPGQKTEQNEKMP